MGIPHKAFDFKRLVFCFAAFFVFFTSNSAKAQENSLFVVEGVMVDVTAENSVAAQQKAFEEAQIKAFETLSQRMVQASEAKPMPAPDVMTVSAMIKDFEVTNEQVSAVRYVGTYTFRFRESDVKQYFSVTGVSYTATASSPLLVLPFFQKNDQNTIWGDDNVWLSAWNRAKPPAGLVPVEVPIGDLMDVGDINDSQGLNYDVSRLSEMQSRYGSSESAILIAAPDDMLSKVPANSDKAFGVLEISVYRTDLGAPQFVQQISVTSDGAETRAQLYDRAVLMAYQALQSDWKTKTVSSSADAAGYEVKIPIKGLKDWVRIQKILNNVPGMNDVAVSSVSPRDARAKLNFRGDEQHLREMLAQAGMGLSDGIPDGEGVMFYELQIDVPQHADSFYNPPSAEPAPEPKAADDFYKAPDSDIEPGAGQPAPDMIQTF